MYNLWLLLVCLVTVPAMAYAHLRLPFHTPDRRHLRVARIVLLATGAGFGWIMARIYGLATELNPVLIFISGVALVHVPAACVLFLKGREQP
ncbi:hypothetical protein M0534_04595 [Methylonatrum kenyense]|uniref:hypothetical protein n=1 Tax=Methylonatrum kenyense TaxID=455253 RepID=UPI0020BD9F9C|nr:hypothetical protein [Methylonatrum kenyense]MCK8515606.1 hypothetical protein [Methylonatrum kenyense]